MKLGLFLKDKKGSALSMVMMIVAILTILSISIIGLAMTNFKLQLVDSKEKKTFYLAEAGLDEAYVLMQQEIKKGIDAAKVSAQNYVNSAIADERYLVATEEDFTSYVLTRPDGSLNDEAVKNLLESVFKKEYKTNINSGLLNVLSDKDNYKGSNNNLDIGFNQNDSSWKYDINNDAIPFKVLATSNFNNDGMIKNVSTMFKIGVPRYDLPYTNSYTTKSINDNVLWQRPITSEGKIYAAAGEVEIKGDVFVYGKDADTVGIQIGDINTSNAPSNFKINGSIYTSKNIEEIESNSTFTVDEGNIYCNTLRINGGLEKDKVSVKGNVFTSDDIELNGLKSGIDINGSYYGFSDGTGIDITHQGSSCIIINSEDIGKISGSYIKITGDDGFENDSPIKTENMNLQKGILVAGTAYIKTGTMYQTGESVAIKGNYRAYSQPLTGLGVVNGTDYSPYNASNITFETFGDLVLPNIFKVFGSKNNVPMLPIHKSTYLQQVDSKDASLLNKGNTEVQGIDIKSDNILYTTGAWIGLDTADNKVKIGNSGNIALESFKTEIQKVLKDYKFYINKLGDPKFTNHRDLDSLDNREYIRNNRTLGKTGRYDFSYTEDTFNQSTGELTYISGENTPFAIIGPDGDTTGLPANTIIRSTSTGRVNGIVITGGDVYIRGNVSYTGMLVSEKDIRFEGNGKKEVRYSRLYLLRKIAGNDNFKNSFVNNGTNISNVILESNVNAAQIPYSTLDNLVSVSDWKNTR